MAASAIKNKVNMITQIVRLRHVVQRWKNKSLTRRHYSSDPDLPAESNSRRIPTGSIAVYVGPKRVRFVIPTRFMNLPVFVALLRLAEEEFGFQTKGGIVLPCEPDLFRKILRFLYEDEERFRRFGLDEFLDAVSEAGGSEDYEQSLLSCKESASSPAYFTPLLPKTRA